MLYDVAPLDAVQDNVAPVAVMLPAARFVGAAGADGNVVNAAGLGTAQELVPPAFVALTCQ